MDLHHQQNELKNQSSETTTLASLSSLLLALSFNVSSIQSTSIVSD